MTGRARSELPLVNRLLYASGSLGGNLISRSRDLWLIFFYAPPGDADIAERVPILALGALLTANRIIEALDDPLIGWWSDRTPSRWGRRIPFVVLATPFYAVFFVLVWMPPDDHETVRNAIYFFVTLQAFHLFSTLSGGPFESLLPEIARSAPGPPLHRPGRRLATHPTGRGASHRERVAGRAGHLPQRPVSLLPAHL